MLRKAREAYKNGYMLIMKYIYYEKLHFKFQTF